MYCAVHCTEIFTKNISERAYLCSERKGYIYVVDHNIIFCLTGQWDMKISQNKVGKNQNITIVLSKYQKWDSKKYHKWDNKKYHKCDKKNHKM